MIMNNKSRQAQQLSDAIAKLLRLVYEMGREDALSGVTCTRDFAKDADKFTANRRKKFEPIA